MKSATKQFFHVDAFCSRPFSGNPAAVCLLEHAAEPRWMQSVAAEKNLSETAFLWPSSGGYILRWFTPAVEVPLCGHATLASAHVLFQEGKARDAIRFDTRSGQLSATQRENEICLDFPQHEVEEKEFETATYFSDPPVFTGIVPLHGHGEPTKFVELASAAAVRDLNPRLDGLRYAGGPDLLVTAQSDTDECDFVSRLFAPAAGIDEDPVTGSAHCSLATYWAAKLSRSELRGFQASKRGGFVGVECRDNRVLLSGSAVTISRGQLLV